MESKRRKRFVYLPWGITLIATICTIASLRTFYLSKKDFQSDMIMLQRFKRELNFNSSTIDSNLSSFATTPLLNVTSTSKPSGIYPYDYITIEMRRQGAVLVHIFGLFYMFAALAIVCDEFFVPALEVITYRLAISNDVAGATFMAAGGSAPELFTSIIGVFLAHSNVGIGTIVGSAVFNILFVIGMCSLFSKEILQLTWWPLFRDCSFYVVSLVILMYSFTNSKIEYSESIVLILVYVTYVIFMKYNQVIEKWIKSKINSCRSKPQSRSNSKISPSVRAIAESISDPRQLSSNPKHTFSYGIVQLIMHTLDPASREENEEHTQAQLYALARNSSISSRAARALCTSPTRKCQMYETSYGNPRPTTPTAVIYENEGVKVVPQGEAGNGKYIGGDFVSPTEDFNTTQPLNNNEMREIEINGKGPVQSNGNASNEPQNPDTDENKGDALDMSWPKTNSKRALYVFLFPIMSLLWLTLPDVRKPQKEKWFMGSFFGSICWIAVFSYIMVWMAHQIGETLYINETIMGLTILAAGTSVPDLITSVIVARKGLGDMAVSSSVGSNIFDVTIGLPFPWLLKSLTTLGAPVDVTSEGLFCSILLLIGMLLFVVLSIASFKWKMNKKLGIVLLLLYVFFLIFALLLEMSVIDCIIGM